MRLETNLFGQINQWYPLRITKLKKSRDHSPAPLLLPSFLWMPWSMPRFSLRQKRSQAKRAGSTNVGSATSMILAAWHRAATHGLLAVTGCWIIEKTSLCWWQHMQSLPWLLEPTLSASGVSWRFSLNQSIDTCFGNQQEARHVVATLRKLGIANPQGREAFLRLWDDGKNFRWGMRGWCNSHLR